MGFIGLKPFIAANLLLWIITLIMPSWRRRLRARSYDSQFFTGIVYGITFIVALLLGFIFARNYYAFMVPATPLTFFIIIILTIGGTFFNLGIAHIITRHGIGQGVSLIICTFAIQHIIDTIRILFTSSEISAFIGLLYFLVVTGFIILLILVAQGRRPVSGVNIPLSVTGFFPVHIAAVVCIPLFLLPLSPVRILVQVCLALAVFFVVNQLYLRHITRSVDRVIPDGTETQPVLCWEWALLWTVIVFMLANGYLLFTTIEQSGTYLVVQTLKSIPTLFVLVLTFMNYYRYWQYRTWKHVYLHSDPAQIYACAAEIQHEGSESVVLDREGWGAAYGLFVGPMAERTVLEKPE